MTRARLLPLDVTKEIRALLPVWLACVTTIGAAAIFTSGRALTGVTQGTILRAGVLAYILGCAALGATAIGHEYSHRTLPLLLSLPASRRRLFTVKLMVLTAMLLGLSVVRMAGVERLLRGGLSDSAVVGLLSFLGGLFLAPWLTMVCRNPLAGAVFALALSGLMLVVGQIVAVLTYGTSLAHTRDADRVQFAVTSWGMIVICAAAAVAGWRMFMRLEAIDGRDSHMRLPRWLRQTRTAAAPGVVRLRRVHPVWLLAKKEFRLQHLTLVVAGLYVLGWLAILLLSRAVDGQWDQPFVLLTVIFGAAVAVLSGSIASAEERQFGTLESQALLPMATAKQWAVKSGVVLGLAVLLAIGLPILLGYMSLPAEDFRIDPWYVGMVIINAAGSLYVSSLCSSGLRALLLSLPIPLIVIVLFRVLSAAPYWGVAAFGTLTRSQGLSIERYQWRLMPVVWLIFFAIALRLAFVNHRSSEHGPQRIWRQAAWMAGSMACAVVIFAGVVAYIAR
jgi:hypothetical protein